MKRSFAFSALLITTALFGNARIASADGYVAHFYMSPVCYPWDLQRIWKKDLQGAPGVSEVRVHSFLPAQGWADWSVFFESSPAVAEKLGESLKCLKHIEAVKDTAGDLALKRFACNQHCTYEAQGCAPTHGFGTRAEAPTLEAAREEAVTSQPDYKQQCLQGGHSPRPNHYSLDCVEQWAPLP